ncbi:MULTISPECIES: tripartite tricarboxylate transporter substrate binding protein [unclassified Cupriavidus]|uniref:Bug family tripartite tricarboxylate transporter substrate binding protein n=1 Tax=unclassified Cupriavidus TaxID=2640874 RepID=UPI001C002133|nr:MULTISPECIES: tripartite tricarboxylate transporter substrate binding protein [unclassified Cupriavidus]MCA3183074.1 tripartite tricarboxylate transporter substrate binding protein [Cupriavidus sp.]MCA3188490.1 tripartite tricarboxylate transporter substrate binding protein [Cupriavidus sp.]MCA3199480.1 tripartite tricarboxylate transporter substrate binding protein [Cupriavidus sp.]MCA3204501.1 tripartite tricarboxylate transporter substrate binding protein [Cupriavidus sp.]MCA3206013.1 tr
MTRLPSRIALAVVACSLAAGASLVFADSFPSKPIQLVIPFPPGGATDVIGRLVGKKLGDKLGQTVVIDNRPGAGTIVGASYVAKAAPDGYTLLASSGTTFSVNPAIHAKLPYDPVKSFEPIGFTGRTGLILLANKDQPVSNLKQLVAAAKAQPGKLTYGSFGSGTTAQFAGEMLFNLAGVKLLHVPYKGSAPAMTDLIGGQIPFTVDTVAAAIPQVKSGKVKAIAVTTARRSTLLPDVPTAAEAGYPGIDADTWLALVAPRGLPPEVKQKLEKALAEVMADPDTRKALTNAGFEPLDGNGAAVSAQIAKELPLMRATAQRANITAD